MVGLVSESVITTGMMIVLSSALEVNIYSKKPFIFSMPEVVRSGVFHALSVYFLPVSSHCFA